MTMNNRPQPPNWIPYMGLLFAVAGIVYQSGQLTNKVERNSGDIAALKATQSSSSSDINAINVRTARIEAKLDLILPTERKALP